MKWEYKASGRVERAGCSAEADGQGARILETSVKRRWGEAGAQPEQRRNGRDKADRDTRAAVRSDEQQQWGF